MFTIAYYLLLIFCVLLHRRQGSTPCLQELTLLGRRRKRRLCKGKVWYMGGYMHSTVMVQKITAQTKDWTMSSALAAYITLWCGCGGWGDFWLNPPLPHPPIPDTNPSCHAVLRSTGSPHVFPTPGQIFRPVKIGGRVGTLGLFGQFYCHRIKYLSLDIEQDIK